MGNPEMRNLFIPLAFVLGGLAAGKLFDAIILGRLRKLTQKTEWEGDDIIIDAIKGVVILWFFLGGIYLSVHSLAIPRGFLEIIKKILMTVVLFSATVVAKRIVAGFVELYTKKNAGILPSTSIFGNIAKIIVYGLGTLVILQSLGISITPILTALGVGGLAVALAFQDTLSNLFSGVHIIISRHIKPGDYIKLEGGSEGYVSDIGWRNTIIKSTSNNIVVVPNSKIASSIIINYNQPDKKIPVTVDIRVSYDCDLSKVEKITTEVGMEVMKNVAGGVIEFTPLIRYHTMEDSAVGFTAILMGKEFVDQYLIKHEFIKRLLARYSVEGIAIPFPVRDVRVTKKQ